MVNKKVRKPAQLKKYLFGNVTLQEQAPHEHFPSQFGHNVQLSGELADLLMWTNTNASPGRTDKQLTERGE